MKEQKIPVCYHFADIEGEGNRLGVRSLFLETTQCKVCDPCHICNFERKVGELYYRNKRFEEAKWMSAADIASLAGQYDVNHIVFGCGEFLDLDGFIDIAASLLANYSMLVTIETSGRNIDLNKAQLDLCNKYNELSGKDLNNELLIHYIASTTGDWENQIFDLDTNDQIKVVMLEPRDLDLLEKIARQVPPCQVYAICTPFGSLKESEVYQAVMNNSSLYNVIPHAPAFLYIEGLE